MTRSEYNICELLLKNKGQTFTKEDIYVKLYGYDAYGDSETSIKERIKNIRKKMRSYKQNPIDTVWGIGYRWQGNH